MELLSGHEKIINKSGISLNAGTLNLGFTVFCLSSAYHMTCGSEGEEPVMKLFCVTT
jgi:hypothetical protein